MVCWVVLLCVGGCWYWAGVGWWQQGTLCARLQCAAGPWRLLGSARGGVPWLAAGAASSPAQSAACVYRVLCPGGAPPTTPAVGCCALCSGTRGRPVLCTAGGAGAAAPAEGVFRPSRGVPPRLREARGCRVSSLHGAMGIVYADVMCGVVWHALVRGGGSERDQAPSRGQAALLSETFVGVGGVDGGGGAGALGQS